MLLPFIILLCVVMSAYFSATETAFNTFNKIRVKNLAEKGNKRAARALELAENYDTLISTILIGNNIVNISLSSIATIFFVDLLTKVDPTSAQSIGATISTVVITIAVLIFGEISPKIIAKSNADKVALSFVYIVNAIIVVLTPLSAIFGAWSKLVMKVFKSKDQNTVTEEELMTIVDEAEEDGTIESDEGDLIRKT